MTPPPRDRTAWLWFAVTALVFLPAMGGEFLNWDDKDWILDNPLVTTAGARPWLDIWIHPTLGAYYPITLTVTRLLWAISSGIDGWVQGHETMANAWTAIGGPAAPFHLASILGFAAAAGLFHEVLRRLGIGTAGRTLGVVVFALHPLRVESVAWAAALRDVLSLDFILLFTLALLSQRASVRRWGAAAAFVAAMLCKSMVFTMAPLPLLLGLLWFRRPLREVLRAAAPSLGLGLAGAAVALVVYRPVAAVNDYVGGSLLGSIPVIAGIQLRYLRLQIAPYDLAALPSPAAGDVMGWFVAAAAVCLLVFAITLARRGQGGLLLVGCLYLLAMGPVSGLLPLAWPVADRYTLLPSLAVAASVAWLAQRPQLGRAILPITAATALALALMTIFTIPRWHDSEALWRHSLTRFPDEFGAHQNYAGVVGGKGRMKEAAFHLVQALELANGKEPDTTKLVGLLMFAELLKMDVSMRRIEPFNAQYDQAGRDPMAMAGLGVELAAARLAPPAQVILRRAAELGAPQSAVSLGYATLAARAHEWDVVLYHTTLGLEEDPEAQQLLALQIMAYDELGELGAALDVAEEVARQQYTGISAEGIVERLRKRIP